jgi:dienelactone hydrolase
VHETIRFPREAWIPLLAGLSWLWIAPGHGFFFTFITAIPGCLLLGSGVAMLLWPGDRRTTHFAALGALVGCLMAIPGLFVTGFSSGMLLLGLAAWSFVATGKHALRLELPPDQAPAPIPSGWLSAQVAADEALLATMTTFFPLPSRNALVRVDAEVTAAREMYESKGWLEKPADYHDAPPALDSPLLRAARRRGIDFEHLSFESGFEPHDDEPGRDRWLGYRANRTAHAWVLRHRQANRPWLVCIHGYQMGYSAIDLVAFPPEWLHQRLGLNLLVPVLPLHGARKAGPRSGDGFLTGDVLDSIHAEAQAMWDIRSMLGWVRAQSESSVGVLGYSLGGYNAALLAALDDQLACAIAGIPLTDIPDALFRHSPPLQARDVADRGLDSERMSEVMRVVSPLVLTPQIPVEHRFIFAAVADRLVDPSQAHRLWEHWERPRIEWYQGAHITFRAHANVRLLIEEGLRESALTL